MGLMGKQIASRKPSFPETVHVCLDKFYIPVGSRLTEREEGGERGTEGVGIRERERQTDRQKERKRGREGGSGNKREGERERQKERKRKRDGGREWE